MQVFDISHFNNQVDVTHKEIKNTNAHSSEDIMGKIQPPPLTEDKSDSS
jgi:hypothetical protein